MAKQQITLKARALRLLAAREYSAHDLRARLYAYAREDDDVSALLDWLQAQGFLSDARFSGSFIRKNASRLGTQRIMRELAARGIPTESLVQEKQRLDADEPARAKAVWMKKFGNDPPSAKAWARQVRFMRQRGFSAEAIRYAMRAGGREKDTFMETALEGMDDV
ncbi:MAG: recombination regulator RecX [Burkholderiaceae bacterium]|jgi:regulatory protein|nr:recombination regulator RecX [Burkholderiaceae bacterium]